MGAQFSQFFPPQPTFTEHDVPSQKGRVFLITGATSGIGFELAQILYRQGGKVYITGRTEEKAKKAIQLIQDSVPQGNHPDNQGQLDFIVLELDDLRTIKASAEAFKAKESKLDVLWNNAGVSQPPLGSVSKQGYELQLATNCLGPFLFTQMLLPLLDAAVSSSPSPGAVRVVWLSSQVAELSSPPEGIIMSELTNPPKDNICNYLNSKVGNWFLSAEFARRYGDRGIISVSLNPGAANTNLLKYAKWMKMLSYPLLHNPQLAAYTELYAGLSPSISLQNNGCYVIPFGRVHNAVAESLLVAMKVKEDGGTGRAKEFWEFCEEKSKDYH
ncbi:hypothetical protein BDW59DRAFT_145165 [Aspergillus cavernicola]|uniref:NAD(P)-binding protein n=1 Tax=Aspergillus cavernicola TaxID=176166 RepID=A0ABR4IF90_9EURO